MYKASLHRGKTGRWGATDQEEMEGRAVNQAVEERFSATEEEVREKLQDLEELAVAYDQKWGEVRVL